MEQVTIFEILGGKEAEEEELLKMALKRGSNIEGFKERLLQNIELKDKEFVAFLKNEFGIGGYSGGGLCVDFDAKGMMVKKTVRDEGILYSWSEIGKRYKEMYYGGFEW